MVVAGESVGGFVLLERIGVGGQASVWKARDRASGALVALKLRMLGRDPTEDERTLREARVLSSLAHPSLVRCPGTIVESERRLLALVLEWIDGVTLGQARRDVRWSRTHAHAALCHVASALAALHARGVVHRDVKGANVLVSERFFADPLDPSTVKLADLGIATSVGNPSALTDVGYVVGTVAFLPPEALRSRGRRDALPARDVFALGVMGWILLEGCHPTGLPEDATVDELAVTYEDHAEAEQLWLPDAPTDDGLVRALRRCLRLDPAQRPADGAELLLHLPPLPRRIVPPTRPGDTGEAPPLPRVMLQPPAPAARPPEVRPAPPRAAVPRASAPVTPLRRSTPACARLGRALAAALLAGATVAIVVTRGARTTSSETSASETEESEPEDEDAGEDEGPTRRVRSAVAPRSATGSMRRGASCAPRWPAPPTLEELRAFAAERPALDRAAFMEGACESEVVGSDSHCAMTHRVGRWLRLRLALEAGTKVAARVEDRAVELVVEPWAGGVDVYVALPPARATVELEAPGVWAGAHSLVLDPEALKPLAFVERGPCR